jgi:excisionase family DNA binding protein
MGAKREKSELAIATQALRSDKQIERRTMRRRRRKSRITIKVPEAASIAGAGERSIRDLIAAGKIPHIRFGRNIVIPKAAFLRWLDSAGELR